MNKLLNNIHSGIIIFLILVTTFFACQDTDDVHAKYIEDGEIIYSNKVDSLITYSGFQRILIEGRLRNAFNVDEVIVEWNDGENMQVFPYTKSSNEVDTIELLIEGLDEGSYEFEVYSRDTDDNISVPTTVFGSSYGENFQTNLVARATDKVTYRYDEKLLIIEFKPASDLTRNTEVKFTDLAGVETIHTLSANESKDSLKNINFEVPIMYRTFYVPTAENSNGDETSIDQFVTDWVEVLIPNIDPVFSELEFSNQLGGVQASWANPEELDLTFQFTYTVDGASKTTTYESLTVEDSLLITGMNPGNQQIQVTIYDAFGSSFGPKLYSVSPIEVVLLNKSVWTIIDVSSQHSGGPASNAIDGDINTIWHSEWQVAQPPYPHHITIDMGSEKLISNFVVFKRQNNNNGQTKHQFLVSIDGIEWVDLGTFAMDNTNNAGQEYPVLPAVSARYIQYKALEGPQFYAFLGELDVYGIE